MYIAFICSVIFKRCKGLLANSFVNTKAAATKIESFIMAWIV